MSIHIVFVAVLMSFERSHLDICLNPVLLSRAVFLYRLSRRLNFVCSQPEQFSIPIHAFNAPILDLIDLYQSVNNYGQSTFVPLE